jgi:hypothetical protein
MKFVGFLILALLLTTPVACPAQNSARIVSENLARKNENSQFRPDEVVVKISRRHIDAKETLKHVGPSVASDNGTGYCFGQGKCDFILTNFHVAERVGSPLEVDGVKVLQTYEATSSQDKGAIWEKSSQGFAVKLVPIRDIAIFRMDHPLKGMHGVPFSARELRDGESVRIYGHPGGRRLTGPWWKVSMT